MLGIRSKFPPGEIHTHSHALVCAWACKCAHTHTYIHTNTPGAQIYDYVYCLREDKVQLFHRASYFPVCSWKVSQGSPQLSVLSADGSLEGRMDVSSRQGHQTDSERWEWWWQEKKKKREGEKIAGVTASTCSPQLSDQRGEDRRRRNATRDRNTHTRMHTHTHTILIYNVSYEWAQAGRGCTVSGQCHVAARLCNCSQQLTHASFVMSCDTTHAAFLLVSNKLNQY